MCRTRATAVGPSAGSVQAFTIAAVGYCGPGCRSNDDGAGRITEALYRREGEVALLMIRGEAGIAKTAVLAAGASSRARPRA